MSSSADVSDDEDCSFKSGSASPAPGDTLPWNLPRHERSKRKIHGRSVLDPAERAVLRIAGEKGSPLSSVFEKNHRLDMSPRIVCGARDGTANATELFRSSILVPLLFFSPTHSDNPKQSLILLYRVAGYMT